MTLKTVYLQFQKSTLDLTADEIIAAKTTISDKTDNVKEMVAAGADINDKGYIEVRTEGGFNLDPTTDYNESNKDIYTGGNYGTTVSENTKPVGDKYTDKVFGESTTTIESELLPGSTTDPNFFPVQQPKSVKKSAEPKFQERL